jgi:hypothetical protein
LACGCAGFIFNFCGLFCPFSEGAETTEATKAL